jgi:hypothetical protein
MTSAPFACVVLDPNDFQMATDSHQGLAGWVAIVTFFEGIGVLMYRKLIIIRLVGDLFTSPINMTWDKMKDNMAEARKEFDQPTIAKRFEYLYNEMKKREQRKRHLYQPF